MKCLTFFRFFVCCFVFEQIDAECFAPPSATLRRESQVHAPGRQDRLDLGAAFAADAVNFVFRNQLKYFVVRTFRRNNLLGARHRNVRSQHQTLPDVSDHNCDMILNVTEFV